jgi:hypothetical protein
MKKDKMKYSLITAAMLSRFEAAHAAAVTRIQNCINEQVAKMKSAIASFVGGLGRFTVPAVWGRCVDPVHNAVFAVPGVLTAEEVLTHETRKLNVIRRLAAQGIQVPEGDFEAIVYGNSPVRIAQGSLVLQNRLIDDETAEDLILAQMVVDWQDESEDGSDPYPLTAVTVSRASLWKVLGPALLNLEGRAYTPAFDTESIGPAILALKPGESLIVGRTTPGFYNGVTLRNAELSAALEIFPGLDEIAVAPIGERFARYEADLANAEGNVTLSPDTFRALAEALRSLGDNVAPATEYVVVRN